MRAKCELLAEELRRLPPAEIRSFARHFGDCYWRANRWDIWGAGFVINNGCGDDSFMDFRSTLISLGRRAYESALNDPDSLAQFDIDRAWARYEGYQYVDGKVYQEIAGVQEGEPYKSPFRGPTAGTPFDPWALSERYPRLAAKYGFKDSDWLSEKRQQEKAERQTSAGERLANFILDSGIIPRCGMIPPPRVVRRVSRTGRSPEGADPQLTWEPFELDEGDYWAALRQIQKLVESRRRPWIHAAKLKGDVHGPPGDDFGEWIESLRARGLM